MYMQNAFTHARTHTHPHRFGLANRVETEGPSLTWRVQRRAHTIECMPEVDSLRLLLRTDLAAHMRAIERRRRATESRPVDAVECCSRANRTAGTTTVSAAAYAAITVCTGLPEMMKRLEAALTTSHTRHTV